MRALVQRRMLQLNAPGVGDSPTKHIGKYEYIGKQYALQKRSDRRGTLRFGLQNSFDESLAEAFFTQIATTHNIWRRK
jgi:hypothetical protein